MGRKWGTRGEPVTLRLPSQVLMRVDELVREGKFESRTEVFNEAVKQLVRMTSWGLRLEKVRVQEQNNVIISVRLPRLYEKYVNDLVEGGMFANRSEAIKTALLHFISSEQEGEK